MENDKKPDDFEIEIIDIPQDEGDNVSRALLKLGSAFSPKSRAWRFTMVGGTLLLVLLLLLISFPSLPAITQMLFTKSSPPGLSLTAKQPYVIANSLPAPLGAAPRSCPSIAHLHTFDQPTFPPGIGGAPVWVVGFSAPGARLVQLDTALYEPQPEGWVYSLMLVVSSRFPGFVVLSGRSMQGNARLLFDNGISIAAQHPITTFFVLRGEHIRPYRFSDAHWRAWYISMYVPAAGCYTLKAIWAGGSWQVNFAAGR